MKQKERAQNNQGGHNTFNKSIDTGRAHDYKRYSILILSISCD